MSTVLRHIAYSLKSGEDDGAGSAWSARSDEGQMPAMNHRDCSRNTALTRRALLTAPFLALPLHGEDVQDRWQGIRRVVAVGDLHGDCDALIAVLKMAGLVDNQADWAGGDSHLVQLGDLPSRGGQTRKAMDLLAKLEVQASAAGGRVHALIGNHDAMVMYGDYRSVLPEEFAEFRTAEFRRDPEGSIRERRCRDGSRSANFPRMRAAPRSSGAGGSSITSPVLWNTRKPSRQTASTADGFGLITR